MNVFRAAQKLVLPAAVPLRAAVNTTAVVGVRAAKPVAKAVPAIRQPVLRDVMPAGRLRSTVRHF